MSKKDKILMKLLSGQSDRNFHFNDLISILETYDFLLRIKGSHHILFREGVEEIINLQPVNGFAKPYQVKQVRELLIKYNFINF
jgi:hypothetical protein